MKKIFKKNQIIITALAALIAAAGYLNHIENSEKELNAVSADSDDNSSDAVQNETGIEAESILADNTYEVSNDIESNEVDITSEPGEAVFVNAVGTVDFIVEAKLLREQTRANNKTMLMEVINNVNLTDEEKQAAVDKITEIADISEREMAAENLIASRGYENVVVTVTDDAADVMIVSDSLSDAERARIEEIVKTKTNVPADKITITAVKTTEAKTD